LRSEYPAFQIVTKTIILRFASQNKLNNKISNLSDPSLVA
jgi:hypothetical protein